MAISSTCALVRFATLSNNQFDLINAERSIFIAPNPAKTQIIINSNKPFNSSTKISVFNVNGQIVKKQTDIVDYSDDKLSFKLDVFDLNDGIYFAEIINDLNFKTIQFILKK